MPRTSPARTSTLISFSRVPKAETGAAERLSKARRTSPGAALVRSGLDMSRSDRLLLIGAPSDRKQSLRDAVAGTSCLVAIAGDTRSDFHELFDYLLNPGDANALQPMIGNGWFIIPTPLLPEG